MNTIRILLVENDEADYVLIKRMLSQISGDKDYKLDWVSGYAEGVDQVKKGQHDIYFIDYMLGQDIGFDLIEDALQDGHTGPFVMLVGADHSESYERIFLDGIYDYMFKNELSASLLERTISYTIERKRVEEALREEKAFTSFIVSEIPYLVINVKQDGTISSVNPAVLDVMGYDESEFLGRNWQDVTMSDGSNIEYATSPGGGVRIVFESVIRTKDGRERTILWSVLGKTTGQQAGKLLHDAGFVLSGEDMTDHLELEAQERQRQKMESLGQLASGVAHELNNLLQPVMLSAELMKASVDKPDIITGASDKIIKNSKNAAKVIDDILVFSRNDHKGVEILPLGQTLLEVLESVRGMLPGTMSLAIAELYQDSMVKALVNKMDLIRILKNIVMNAAHAMEQTGQVDVVMDQMTLDETSAKTAGLDAGHFMRVDVSDTGRGIEPDHLEKIFDPFFTTRDVGGGTGLGLPIVYNILKSWNGTVTVKSEPGTGSTFSLYIPVLEG